jgi:hypothetical protein
MNDADIAEIQTAFQEMKGAADQIVAGIDGIAALIKRQDFDGALHELANLREGAAVLAEGCTEGARRAAAL